MRSPRLWLVVLVLVAGCGGEGSAPPAVRQATPLDHATTGTIAGEVRLEGATPAMGEIRFGGAAECAAPHPGGVVPTGDVLVHDGLVENAFVYLKAGLGERVFAVPSTPLVIDQVGCLYRPRVAGAQVGQAILFTNDDPVLHNVHGSPSASRPWNVSLARRGARREI